MVDQKAQNASACIASRPKQALDIDNLITSVIGDFDDDAEVDFIGSFSVPDDVFEEDSDLEVNWEALKNLSRRDMTV